MVGRAACTPNTTGKSPMSRTFGVDYGTTYLDFHGLGPAWQSKAPAVAPAGGLASRGAHRKWRWPALTTKGALASNLDVREQGYSSAVVTAECTVGTRSGTPAPGGGTQRIILGRSYALPAGAPAGAQRRRQAGGVERDPPEKRHFYKACRRGRHIDDTYVVDPNSTLLSQAEAAAMLERSAWSASQNECSTKKVPDVLDLSGTTATTLRLAPSPTWEEAYDQHAKEYDYSKAREGRMTPRRRHILSDPKDSVFHQVEPTEMVLRDYVIQKGSWR